MASFTAFQDEKWQQFEKEVSSLSNKEAPQGTHGIEDPERKRHDYDFKIHEEIGHGSYSHVLRVVEKTSEHPFAMKRLLKSHIVKEKKTHEVQREKDALIALKDVSRVVHLFFSFQDSDYLYYILDLCVNGDLQQFLTRFGCFPVDVCKFFAAQLVEAIEFCHSKNFVHRDIKPDNCLLDHHLQIKLCDFASARELKNVGTERKHSFVGTPQFVAPEILQSLPASFAADWWSVGSCIYALATGMHAFEAGSEYLTFQMIVDGKFKVPDLIDAGLTDFIQSLLVVDPAKRLGGEFADGATKVRAHSLFASFDWDSLATAQISLPPYLPWLRSEVMTKDEILSVPDDEGAPFNPDDCPFSKFLENKPVQRWCYCFSYQGLRPAKLVAVVLSEGNLWFFDTESLEPRERTFLQSQDLAIALFKDTFMIQTNWRRYYLRLFQDDDVDFLEHPEHIIYVSNDSASSWARAVTDVISRAGEYTPQHFPM